jgi:hypothetical protein
MESIRYQSMQGENEFERKDCPRFPCFRCGWLGDHPALIVLSPTTVTNGGRRRDARCASALDDAGHSYDWSHPLEWIPSGPCVLADGDLWCLDSHVALRNRKSHAARDLEDTAVLRPIGACMCA